MSPSVGLCVFLVLFGVASDKLVSSWQRPPPRPARPLGWSLGAFWSSQPSAGSSLGYQVVSCDGPVVMPVVWSVVTAIFTFPNGNKGFGPVQVLFFPALRYSLSGDPEPRSGHR